MNSRKRKAAAKLRERMRMPAWLRQFKDSVSYPELIHHEQVEGVECCWLAVQRKRHYEVPGALPEIKAAIRQAEVVEAATGSDVAILFTNNERLTEAQVEEAMFVTAEAGFGCGFLGASGKIHQYRILNRFTEGNLIQDLFAAAFPHAAR